MIRPMLSQEECELLPKTTQFRPPQARGYSININSEESEQVL